MNAVSREFIAFELRHNDEPLGRVCAGAVEFYEEEEVCYLQARFWLGLRGIRLHLPTSCSLLRKEP